MMQEDRHRAIFIAVKVITNFLQFETDPSSIRLEMAPICMKPL